MYVNIKGRGHGEDAMALCSYMARCTTVSLHILQPLSHCVALFISIAVESAVSSTSKCQLVSLVAPVVSVVVMLEVWSVVSVVVMLEVWSVVSVVVMLEVWSLRCHLQNLHCMPKKMFLIQCIMVFLQYRLFSNTIALCSV